jgi:hypothetical protein
LVSDEKTQVKKHQVLSEEHRLKSINAVRELQVMPASGADRLKATMLT